MHKAFGEDSQSLGPWGWLETLGFAGSVGCKEGVFGWLLILPRNPYFFFFLCVYFFFSQSLTWGALYSKAAAALYGVPSPQPFSPQSFQNAPSTSLKPVPPPLVQVPLLFSPTAPGTYLPFFSQFPVLQPGPCSLSVPIPCAVGFQKLKYQLCFWKP